MNASIPYDVLKKAARLSAAAALKEDKARRDITTRLACDGRQKVSALVHCREEAVFCGRMVFEEVFRRLQPSCRMEWFVEDGQSLSAQSRVCRLQGQARWLLAGERTALNFIARLSGVATLTRRYVERLAPYRHTALYDTRKTTPGLRLLEKWAVQVGGGRPHRWDLSAAVMIKDNHRVVLKELDIPTLVKRIRRRTKTPVYLEVDDWDQFIEGIQADVDVIVLDNMSYSMIKRAVAYRNAHNKKIDLEVSGGVSLNRIAAIARCGIERISVGALTQKVHNIDFSMELLP